MLRARLKGLPAAPSRDVVVKARAFPDAHDELEAKVSLSGDALQVVVPARGFDASGSVWIVGCVGDACSGTLVFVKSFRGETDLGEIAMGKTAPVLVAGRVLTRARKPAADAWTCVVVAGPGGEPIAFSDFGVSTDVEGAFVIHGDVRPSDKALLVGTVGEWFMPRPATFSRGATTVELVATDTVDARGEASLPSGGAWDELVVGVQPVKGSIGAATVVGATDVRRVGRGIEFPAGPSYEVKGLAPGDYELRLALRGSAAPLARARASLDAAFDAAKLPPLTASAAVRRARVRVVAADGRVLGGARLWAREAGARGVFREVSMGKEGAASVPFADDAVELVACAPGTDYASTTAQKGAEATLTPPPAKTTQLTVNVPDDAPRASGGVRLGLRIEWRAPVDAPANSVDVRRDDKDARKLDDVRIDVPAKGGAVVTIPRPGWYLVSLVAAGGDAVAERAVGPLRVADTGPLLVSLPVPAEDVRKFLESAAKPRR